MSNNEIERHERTGWRHVLRSLRHRNYRLYFAGQGVSLIGTWMQSMAMSWLVYRLTGSALLLGTVAFMSQIPAFILSPFGGLLADRMNRRRILVVTQALSMLQAFALAVLVLLGIIKVWEILVLSVFIGLITAFDMPTRQSFVVELTEDKDDLGNAIALNSTMFNGARLVGPAIAGALVAAIGEGNVFLLNGISYLAVIASLLAMRITPRQERRKAEPALRGLAEGFKYTWGFLPVRYTLLLLAVVSLVGMPYAILMPVFAKSILHGGPATMGVLMASTGIGALIGALYLASRRTVLGLGRLIPVASWVFGASLIGFAYSRVLWLSMIFLLFVGLGMITQMASSNTIIQTIVDEDKRGRVMSFYAMAFMGTAPFGSLLAGALAHSLGPQRTVMLGGIISAVGGLVFALLLPSLRAIVRPIYVRMGILAGLEPATETAPQFTLPTKEDDPKDADD